MATVNYMKQKIQTQSVMRFVLRYVIQEPESVCGYGAYGSLAANILRLAKNVSKIGDNADDLENIIALSALVGLTVAGVYKLVEALQNQNKTEISDRLVKEIIGELSQEYGLESEIESQTEPEQEYTLTL